MQTINLEDMYTVKDIADIKELGLKRSRISQLFKEAGVLKLGNKYYATKEEVVEILKRSNQSIKPYFVRNISPEELL